MAARLPRRAFLSSSLAIGLSAPRLARAGAAPPPLPALPVALRVASRDPARAGEARVPVVDATFVAEQLAAVASLYAPFGVSFAATDPSDLAARYLTLETRADRDALGAELGVDVVDVFFVASLRDVDDPSLYRMGVTWRKLTDLTKKYVIVAASARPTTLAHELGHYLGLDHTSVKNNLMSYDRDGGTVFLDARQGATVRRNAEVFHRLHGARSRPDR